jgi:hypothetical protein
LKATGRRFAQDRPRPWFPDAITATRPTRPLDVHANGDRIAIAKPPDVLPAQRGPVFVFNFFEELRRP